MKPIVFAACLAPALWMLAGVFGIAGADLGPDPIEVLLDRAGKTAINLLCITLAVSPAATLLKRPKLLRVRRMLGLFAFAYALLHFTIYLVLDRSLDAQMIVDDLGERPYITIGFLALLGLIPLAATSTQRAMRRLGRRWQTLHRLVYVIVPLAVVHYWWQVKRDVTEPLVYAVIVAALLGYRALRASTAKSGSATARERT